MGAHQIRIYMMATGFFSTTKKNFFKNQQQTYLDHYYHC